MRTLVAPPKLFVLGSLCKAPRLRYFRWLSAVLAFVSEKQMNVEVQLGGHKLAHMQEP